jgi:ABC-type uncharacterized transport system permease subunit
MLAIAKICEALLPIAYAFAVSVYAIGFFRPDEPIVRARRPALLSALGLHTLLIWSWTAYHGHCLVYSPFELMTLISFTVTLTYLVVELATNEKSTGLFVLGLALLMQVCSAMFAPSIEASTTQPYLLNDAIGLHISAALIGYTAFTISAVYGGLYLMLYHQIRSSKFGTFYNRLPSLPKLERMSEGATVVGLLFLTIAIIIGVIFVPRVVPTFRYSDPKLISTIAIWAIYLIALAAKYVARMDGRRVMILGLLGFFGTILSMTVLNLITSGFHRFG